MYFAFYNHIRNIEKDIKMQSIKKFTLSTLFLALGVASFTSQAEVIEHAEPEFLFHYDSDEDYRNPSIIPNNGRLGTMDMYQTDSFTFSFYLYVDKMALNTWYSPLSFTTDDYKRLPSVFMRQNTGMEGYKLHIPSTSVGNWNSFVDAPDELAYDTWNHIVVQYDGTEQRTYHNGELKVAAERTSFINSPDFNGVTSIPVKSGHQSYLNQFFGGIDDLRMYDSVVDVDTLYVQQTEKWPSTFIPTGKVEGIDASTIQPEQEDSSSAGGSEVANVSAPLIGGIGLSLVGLLGLRRKSEKSM